MKWLLFLGVIIFPFYFLKAQDTIVKRKGEKIIVKLVEVNPYDIRYKRFDYQDGPVFTILKQEVKYVVYANGVVENFESYVPPSANSNSFALDLSIQSSGRYYYYRDRKITEADMLAVAKKINDKRINLMIEKVEEKKFVQNSAMIGSFVLIAGGFGLYAANLPARVKRGYAVPAPTSGQLQQQNNGTYLMLAGVTSGLISVYFRIDRTRHAHIVMDMYNNTLDLNPPNSKTIR